MYAGVHKCQKLETFSEGKPLWVFFRQNVKSLTFDPPIPPPSISTGIVQTRAVICEGVFSKAISKADGNQLTFVNMKTFQTRENLKSWQSRVTLDSIRNSCDVLESHHTQSPLFH